MYILLSSKTSLYEVTTKRKASKFDYSNAATASFEGRTGGVLAQQGKYDSQLDHLKIASQAAFVALNPIDWSARKYEAAVSLTSTDGRGISFDGTSSSAGLGYTLALALAYREQAGKPHEVSPYVFATGKVSASGDVHAIGHIETKVEAVCRFMADESRVGEPFWVAYPASNEDELPEELKDKVTELGGTLLPVTRVPEVLIALLGDDYDGASDNRWSPFKGLESFDYRDQFRFFGRERAIDKLVGDYQANRALLVVTGVSGSGKSSLVKAGVLPALKKATPALEWQIVEPKAHDSSASLLAELLANTPGLTLTQSPEACAEALLESPEDLPLQIQLKDNNTQTAIPHLWFIDQYEDVISLYRETTDHLVRLSDLLDSLSKAIPGLKVVVSIRLEYFDTLEKTGRFASSSVPNKLTPDEWAAIVNHQATCAGLEYEEGLADRLVDEASSVGNALPALEYLLSSMHELATKEDPHAKLLAYAHYGSLKGIKGVLAEKAESVMARHGGLAEEFFEYFIGANTEGRLYARSVSLNEIQIQRPELHILVTDLIEAQLVIESHSTGEAHPRSVVKLAHDCLFNEASAQNEGCWHRLAQWLVLQQAFLSWFARNEGYFLEWKVESNERSHHLLRMGELEKVRSFTQRVPIIRRDIRQYIDYSQQHQNTLLKLDMKKQRRRFSVAMVLVLITTLSAGLAWLKMNEAEAQRKEAVMQSDYAESLLIQVRKNLNYMNFDLMDILEKYTPASIQIKVNEDVNKLVNLLDAIHINENPVMRLKAISSLNTNVIRTEQSNTKNDMSTEELDMLIAALNNNAPGHNLITDTRLKAVTLAKRVELLLKGEHNNLQKILDLQLQVKELFEKNVRIAFTSDSVYGHFDQAKTLNDLAISYAVLARIYNEQGSTDMELKIYRDRQAVLQRLVALDKRNIHTQEQLWINYFRIGALYLHKGETGAALKAYQNCLDIIERLVELDKGNAQYERGLANNYYRLVKLQKKQGGGERLAEFAERYAELPISDQELWEGLYISGSWYLLISDEPQNVISIVEQKIKEFEPARQLLLSTNLAHAYLLDNQYQKALTIYQRYLGQTMSDGQLWDKAILDDFNALQKEGVNNPNFAKVAKEVFGATL